jgi:hypothetical protein
MVEPLGCSVKLWWLNRGIVWVQLRWLEPIRHKRGLLGECGAHTGGETSVGMLQARWNYWTALYWLPSTHLRSVYGCSLVQWVFGFLRIITTHGECVQPLQSVKLLWQSCSSGMDPHMISETWDGFWLSFGWVMSKWALLGCGRSWWDSMAQSRLLSWGDEFAAILLILKA